MVATLFKTLSPERNDDFKKGCFIPKANGNDDLFKTVFIDPKELTVEEYVHPKKVKKVSEADKSRKARSSIGLGYKR
jgi:hypothetical protein